MQVHARTYPWVDARRDAAVNARVRVPVCVLASASAIRVVHIARARMCTCGPHLMCAWRTFLHHAVRLSLWHTCDARVAHITRARCACKLRVRVPHT